MTLHTLLALLQLGDGLFPAGGFAHSFGLETYAQEGRVRDRVGLEAFVGAHLEGAAGPGDAVAVAVAARLAAAGDVAARCELAAQAARATADDMWTFTPALELAGLRHARLEMRLFRS